MKHECPESELLNPNPSPKVRRIVRKGFYFRKSDGQWIRRYRCLKCGIHFSSSSLTAAYRQKKRQLNHQIGLLLDSGVSQRRVAILLGVNRKTVVRKFRFLSRQYQEKQATWLKEIESKPLSYIQFDDLETSEHSKCKPLSVALAVEPRSRKILGFEVSQMPPKGDLARVGFQKYGPRPDQRANGWDALFEKLKPLLAEEAVCRSDSNPHYPGHLFRHHPHVKHETVLSRRSCVAGQGELKKIGFDPLFSLNHTCAMLRANLNRLFRKTWCTTKTKQGLIDHLHLYVHFHNQRLTPALPGLAGVD